MVVKSNAGHDQDNFYVIVKLENGFGYIADGRRRKLEKPKRKNILHLSMTNEVLDITTLDTNQKIRRVLWSYNNKTTSVAD